MTAAPLDFAAAARPRRGIITICMIAAALLQTLDATIANVALPHMQAALGASQDSISWVLTSFIMAGAIGMPITGWLSDRLGSRNLFIGSAVVFLLASAACGASNSLAAMVVCRGIQGLAAVFLGPMTQTIKFDVSPPSKQAQTMASFGMIVMVAPISGTFIGGYMTDYLSWRRIYYVNLPIGIPALVLLWWLLPSRPLESRRLDLFGYSALALRVGGPCSSCSIAASTMTGSAASRRSSKPAWGYRRSGYSSSIRHSAASRCSRAN